MVIREQVREFVLTALYAPPDFRDDQSLLDAGIIDSTGLLEVIAFLEQSHPIHVANREIRPDNFDSIIAITAYVERKLAEGTGPTADRAADSAGRGNLGAPG